ncbi:MAG: sensor histidine kinase N-terminal domain-containing protein [Gammaproteobacteria bacterium]|nr:sensor histidine kinase N-terminal domain-containing protein [Gammaproteobacteria bacterium]
MLSIRRRLLIQLAWVAFVLAAVMYILGGNIARNTLTASHDQLLLSSARIISERVYSSEAGTVVDIPPSALSMLAEISDNRLLYRITVNQTVVVGVADLPANTATTLESGRGHVETARYKAAPIRLATLQKTVALEDGYAIVEINLGQPLSAQAEIIDAAARRTALLSVGIFILAALLGALAINQALQPLRRISEAVSRRGPRDLRQITHPVPKELEPIIGAINHFLERLSDSLRKTETFISEAAHHIRTPLATMRMQVDLAMTKPMESETQQELLKIKKSIDHSSRVTGQMLDHAMVSYRSERAKRKPIDLSTIIGRLYQSFATTAELRDIDFHLHCQPSLSLRGDPVLIETALRNLVDNALKYTATEGEVEVSAVQDGEEIVVAVSNIGINPVQPLQTLTERFTRGSNSDGVVGSGLGLTIVSEVAQSHGGSLRQFNQGEMIVYELRFAMH